MERQPERIMTLTDYVIRYGRQTFTELPFNEVDSLVLSKLTNADFWGYVSQHPKLSLRICQLPVIIPIVKLCAKMWNRAEGARLTKAIISSRRYGQLKMHDFRTVVSNEQQFMALTISLGDRPGAPQYLSFRGTDESFGGWREDMELTYRHDLPSWNLALAYTKHIATKYKGQLILGGHSKGGNLATYAGLKSPLRIRQRIIAIYNHDGPGFLPGTFTDNEWSAMADKMHKSIPETSIIGLIMENQIDHCDIVKNSAKFIVQHDQLNWLINGTEFARASNISDLARHSHNVIMKWIRKLEPNDRQRFVDNLFRMLQATDTNDFVTLNSHARRDFWKTRRQIMKVERKQRRIVWQTLLLLAKLSLAEYFQHLGGRIRQIFGKTK